MNPFLKFSSAIAAQSDSLGTTDPSGWAIGDIWIDLLIIFALAGALFHMISKMRQTYFRSVSRDEIKLQRLKDQKPEEATEAEHQLALQYLDEVFDHWTIVSEPGEDELRAPTSNRELNHARETLEQAIECGPTDPDIIARINELGEVLNSNAARKFAGSKGLMVVAGGIGVFLAYTMKEADQSWFSALFEVYFIWFGILFYFFASRAPSFLIEKRQRHIGAMNISSGLVGFFIGLFFGAPTYDSLTKYSNGSSRRSTHFNLIGLLFMLVGLLILGSAILFFGILNYVRNFIIYI